MISLKKGSLSLSVNAIVIIILALTMLGLGLGFIRNIFEKVSSDFEEQVAKEPEPPFASSSEPLTLSREKVVTYPGSTELVKLGTYNPSAESWNIGGGTSGSLKCENYDSDSSLCVSIGCQYKSGSCIKKSSDPKCSNAKSEQVCKKISCFWNSKDKKCTGQASSGLTTTCSDNELGVSSNEFIKFTPTVISSGESKISVGLFETPRSAVKGTYLCQIEISGYTKDFAIIVK